MLIDTNIINYLTDTIQPYEPLSRLIFEMIETGDASAVLSIISIAEIMKGPIKRAIIQPNWKLPKNPGAVARVMPIAVTTRTTKELSKERRRP